MIVHKAVTVGTSVAVHTLRSTASCSECGISCSDLSLPSVGNAVDAVFCWTWLLMGMLLVFQVVSSHCNQQLVHELVVHGIAFASVLFWEREQTDKG